MLLENNNLNLNSPKQIDASKIFGISKKIMVPYFSQKSDLVPDVDDGYIFDDATTTSILMMGDIDKYRSTAQPSLSVTVSNTVIHVQLDEVSSHHTFHETKIFCNCDGIDTNLEYISMLCLFV